MTSHTIPGWRTLYKLFAGAGVVISLGCCGTRDCGECGHRSWLPRLGGCVDKCSDIPRGAIPQPIGTYTNAYLNRQADKAEADDFVIYYNEWLDHTTQFGPFGATHMEQIAQRLATVTYPVVLQPVEDGELNKQRRQTVVNLLIQANYPDADTRVIVAQSTAEGLYGDQGARIYPQMLFSGMRSGFGGGGMNGMGGGFGGGFGSGGGYSAFGGGFGGFR